MSNYIKQVIPIGRLEWGKFPASNTEPIIYLYYRPNGNLMMYKTVDDLEINLTTISSYDNIILFRFDSSDDISNLDITKFAARTLDVAKAEYRREFIKNVNQYSYILIPAIHGIENIFINDELATSQYSMQGIYEHNNKYYFVYRTEIQLDILTNVTITVTVNRITQDSVDVFIKHISDYNDPHKTVDTTIDKILQLKLFSKLYWKRGDYDFEQIDINIIEGNTLQIENTPIIDKQILLDTDENIIYIDIDGERLSFSGSGGGGTITEIVDGDANFLTEAGVYLCSGNKTNFPILKNPYSGDLNNSDYKFILEVSLIGGDNPYIHQLIHINSKLLTRKKIEESFSLWYITDFAYTKQDIYDNTLQTEDKSVVGGINELKERVDNIHGGGVQSNTIIGIEIVDKLPIEIKENVLYIELIPYEDGIGHMIIEPPFKVR